MEMSLFDITQRVRAYTRDFTRSIFREEDVRSYSNEAIERIIQQVSELRGMKLLVMNEDKPILLPSQYHYLIAIYSSSRLFAQDERHYQATTLMNEFEYKISQLKTAIENGEVIILDENGNIVESSLPIDYVDDIYFKRKYRDEW